MFDFKHQSGICAIGLRNKEISFEHPAHWIIYCVSAKGIDDACESHCPHFIQVAPRDETISSVQNVVLDYEEANYCVNVVFVLDNALVLKWKQWSKIALNVNKP